MRKTTSFIKKKLSKKLIQLDSSSAFKKAF